MPVRSSVCTYSPSNVTNSKYSLVVPSSGSLSVGHYKPLASTTNTYHSSSPKSYTSGVSSSSGLGSSSYSSRYSLFSTHYSPSSLHNSSHSSLSSNSSASSYTPSSTSSSGHYRPLSSAQSSFTTTTTTSSSPGNRFESKSLSSTSPSTYMRYSPGSSAASSTSIGSAGSSLLDRSDTLTRGYSSSISNYNYRPTSSASLSRRLSSTSLSGSTNEKLPSGVPKGLVNLGNTCYMNAVIQSLYSVDSFRNFILHASHDKLLTSELSDLFKSMKNSSSPVSPANFKSTFSRHQAKFSGLGQQDAQEFLRYLINGVHEEYNQATRRPRRSVPPRAPKTADEAWSQYRDIVDDSPLVDIVVGQMCSTIVCCVCQNKSLCWDPFWDLSLPLVRGRHSCKLSDVVQDFIAKETLDSDERPICSNCKQATRSTKQIKVCRLPKLVILHLKKFTNDGYKLTSPEIRIDNMLTFNNTTYTLTACISHHGHSSSSGHYTSHCKYSSRWFHFNDDRVRDITSSFDGAKLDDAYVLFYAQSSSSSSLSLSSSSSSSLSTLNQSKL